MNIAPSEDLRLRNGPSVGTVLAWVGLGLSLAGIGITGWRWHRYRRGIASWTGCLPETPTGAWLHPATGHMPNAVIRAVYDTMVGLVGDDVTDVDGLVRGTAWELASCDEQGLTPAARGHLRRVAEAVLGHEPLHELLAEEARG